MLQYIENVDYCRNEYQETNIDEQIAELRQILSYQASDYDVYLNIRNKIYKQIKINELAVTRILSDIRELRKTNPASADIVEYFIINNTSSYADIAEEFGVSRQAIFERLKLLSAKYYWLKNLMEIKGNLDRKNTGSP